MLAYLLLFGFFAAGAFNEGSRSKGHGRTGPLFLVGLALTILMIGLRFMVGGDWYSYDRMFRGAKYADLDDVLSTGDPGYQFLNWAVQQIGADFWLVNLICGLIFGWGLFRFARAQANPWLAMVVAVPYLIIVVAMGYTRQAVALGILMAGLAAHSRNHSVLRFAVYVAAAAIFHRTAVVMMPLIALAAPRNRLINLAFTAVLVYYLYDFFLSDTVDKYLSVYVRTSFSSQGAAIRVAMNVVPAVIFLAFAHRFKFSPVEHSLWRNFSLAALVLLAALVASPSSTAVDRIALYVIPLQIAILSRIPSVFTAKFFGFSAVILYSLMVQLTWLGFAAHANRWLPYRIYPIWGS